MFAVLILSSALVVSTIACDGVEVESTSALAAAIVSGVDDGGHPAVGRLTGSKGGCTGTLIGARSVLTAAHCVDGAADSFEVGDKSYAVVNRAIHPNYELGVTLPELNTPSKFSISDVAVLRLAAAVVGIKPVPLATRNPKLGERLTIVGFGRTGVDDKSPPKKRKTENTVGSVQEKFFLFGHGYGLKGGPGMTCSGDSGGPSLIIEDAEEQLVGVHSMGDSGCQSYGFDAAVPYHVGWITNVSGDVGVVGDDRPPAVQFVDSPARVAGTFTVRARAQDDDSGMRELVLLVDGQERWRVAADVLTMELGGLAAGAHELRAVATDRAGNTAEATVSVVVEMGGQPISDTVSTAPDDTLSGGCSLAAHGAPPPETDAGTVLLLALAAWLVAARASRTTRT